MQDWLIKCTFSSSKNNCTIEHSREYIAYLKGEHEIMLACWEFPLVLELYEVENFKILTLKSYESSLNVIFCMLLASISKNIVLETIL